MPCVNLRVHPIVTSTVIGMVIAPVSSLQSSMYRNARGDGPTLYVVTPSYIGDIDSWTNFMASVLSLNTGNDSRECGFHKTIMTTIVGNETERVAFEQRLQKVSSSCSTGSSHSDRVQIKTMEEVLRSTRAVSESDMDILLKHVKSGHIVRASDPEEDEHGDWQVLLYPYQASKKFYGCLDAAGVSVEEGSYPHPRDVCVVVDSDSRMLRNSFCHLATEYMKTKSVFISPYPDQWHTRHNAAVEYSRKLLNLSPKPSENDDAFGEFFAMEAYHWVFEVRIVQQFLRKVALARVMMGWIARPAGAERHGFPEEAYYHFLYSRRQSFGYNFINIYETYEQLLGRDIFDKLRQASRPDNAIVESISIRLEPLDRQQVISIGETLRSHGVLMMRCGKIETENVKILMQFVDICASAYKRTDTNGLAISGLPPRCISQ